MYQARGFASHCPVICYLLTYILQLAPVQANMVRGNVGALAMWVSFRMPRGTPVRTALKQYHLAPTKAKRQQLRAIQIYLKDRFGSPAEASHVIEASSANPWIGDRKRQFHRKVIGNLQTMQPMVSDVFLTWHILVYRFPVSASDWIRTRWRSFHALRC